MDFSESLNAIHLELQNEFKERKLYSRFLHQSYARLHKKGMGFASVLDFEKKRDNVKSCSSFLDFSQTDPGAFKLLKAD
ncbi:MAG: hypothetical protein K2K14_01960, partial [Ruminococcus sp.]|nr:hypothetical protein [Ruminococcus sp.]